MGLACRRDFVLSLAFVFFVKFVLARECGGSRVHYNTCFESVFSCHSVMSLRRPTYRIIL